jgi:glycosyltransferase involved in cell wall biosynthesis
MSQVDISLAIVTRNRPGFLFTCLQSIHQQDFSPFEIVVSDDSDPSFQGEVERISREFGCRYFSGPRKGLYANRNFISKKCRGTHIRTIDDDHQFPPGHFARCKKSVVEKPTWIHTTGELQFFHGKKCAFFPFANELDAAGVGKTLQNPSDGWGIADGSTIYPAFVFQSGFKMIERFGYGRGYLEFGALLYKNGIKSRPVPGEYVEHHSDAPPRSELFSDYVSKAYASFCYHFFFRPGLKGAIRYLLPIFFKAPDKEKFVKIIPNVVKLGIRRWKKGEISLV